MNRLESRVAEMLQAESAHANTPVPPLARTLEAGRRGRTRRRAGAALAVVSAVVVASVGASLAVPALQGADPGRTGPVSRPSGDPPVSPSEEPSGTLYDNGTPQEREVRCAEVPPVPAGGPVESSVAWTAGVVTLWLDDEQGSTGYALSFRDDPTCVQRADVRRAINHALATAGHPPI